MPTHSGHAMRLVPDIGTASNRYATPSLVRLLVKAPRWRTMLSKSEQAIKRLAATEGAQASYITPAIRLVILSPAVIDAILRGNLRAGVDVATLPSVRDLLNRDCEGAEQSVEELFKRR